MSGSKTRRSCAGWTPADTTPTADVRMTLGELDAVIACVEASGGTQAAWGPEIGSALTKLRAARAARGGRT